MSGWPQQSLRKSSTTGASVRSETVRRLAVLAILAILAILAVLMVSPALTQSERRYGDEPDAWKSIESVGLCVTRETEAVAVAL